MSQPLRFALCIVLAALAGSVASAQIEAIAKPRSDLELSFTVSGRVDAVLVERGEQVETGQPLLRLDDSESGSRLELLRLRAESELEALAAEAEWKMAVADEKRVRDAHARDAAADFEVERAELEVKRKRLAFELFEQRRIEARHQLRQAEIQHERFTLRAPGSGSVEDINVEAGESIEALRPVIRVVQTDPLIVSAPTPLARSQSLDVGAPAWIRFRLPGETAAREGEIVHIAKVADAASETRIVRIELPNSDDLPAGTPVLVYYEPPGSGAQGGAQANVLSR